MQLLHRQFLNTCIDLLSIQYNQNRIKLRKLLNSSYTLSSHNDPIASFLSMQDNVYNPVDAKELNRLVKEQIKLNKMMLIGKHILNTKTHK